MVFPSRLLAFCLLGLCALGCRSATVKDADGLFIRKAGRFTLGNGDVLELSQPHADGFSLLFHLTDPQGKALLMSPQSWATYTRWSMYYANASQDLWLASGDIGHYHWRHMPNGFYVLCRDPTCKQNHTPAAFRKRLPASALEARKPKSGGTSALPTGKP